MRPNRQALIVWYKHYRNVKHIKRLGHLIYASKKLKYAILYVNQDDMEKIEKQLQRYNFVKKIDYSYRPFIQSQFNRMKSEKEKESIYKLGI